MESFVTQETHLFHDSIRNNLRIANLDASDEEIISACKKASVYDFIMSLSQGYDTPVGELGDPKRTFPMSALLTDIPLSPSLQPYLNSNLSISLSSVSA